jgi:hypothetical protein
VAVRGRHQTLDVPVVDLSRDPDFEPKAARVLDLYAREWDGQALGGVRSPV